MPSATFSHSLDSLYQENQSWLRHWLYSRLGCSEKAADLAQDTFLRLLKTGNQPPAGESRRYLTRIAKGLMIDSYRRQKIEEAYLESLSRLPEAAAPSPETHHAIIETLSEIAALLDGLPHKVRRALLLRQLDGLSYAAIASELSVSVSSVEKYVARGLAACCLALEVP
ncbi:MAG: sigma-70 family RNA polymerase sigma factor [Marinobacter sp.]|uniref:sigma-70 family RNA polymerase sigma factor n=1 Tax=Marinobacter sp. TaxID=50741 RepID=UPI00299F1849|nr:sigma-70 family RNA polymerase sigma factor [Marinobacter sp.]MDX1635200.1 sigma-70 family RNA polymerase sigma factor [Marinobacter sp.]